MVVYLNLRYVNNEVRIKFTIYAGISKYVDILREQMDAGGSTPGLLSPTDVVWDTRSPGARRLVVVVVGDFRTS